MGLVCYHDDDMIMIMMTLEYDENWEYDDIKIWRCDDELEGCLMATSPQKTGLRLHNTRFLYRELFVCLQRFTFAAFWVDGSILKFVLSCLNVYPLTICLCVQGCFNDPLLKPRLPGWTWKATIVEQSFAPGARHHSQSGKKVSRFRSRGAWRANCRQLAPYMA